MQMSKINDCYKYAQCRYTTCLTVDNKIVTVRTFIRKKLKNSLEQ